VGKITAAPAFVGSSLDVILPTLPTGGGPKTRGRHLAREIGLQLLLLIGTLAVAEAALRLIDLRELRDGYSVGSAMFHRYDPELGWGAVPGTAGIYRGSRTIHIRTNSLGFRDIEPEPTTKPTVLFVGDSFVWGYDVEASERFTDLLRAELPGARIVNSGISGYGTDQEYLLLRRIWDRFEPRVVVLMFCTDNDRDDNSTNVLSTGYYKPYLAQAADGEWRFAGRPVPKSRQVYFVDNALVKNLWLARAAVTGYVVARHPRITVADPTERLVGMMRDLVESRGAKLLVGLERTEPRLAAYLSAQHIPYTAFDGAEVYPTDGAHWTPAGHRLVGDRLRTLLAMSNVLDAKDLALTSPSRIPGSR
jgi:lysophospholipase L1-like esterase